MLPAELSAGGLPLLGMGRDVPDGRMFLRNGRLDIDWKRDGAPTRTSSGCATTSRDVAARARRPLRRQPALVPRARDHRPPARRRADGPPRRRGRRRPLRQRVRLSRPAHRRRLGDARPDRARTRASRSPHSPTASPTRSSSPTDPPRRRPPHDRDRTSRHRRFTEEMLGHVTFGETDFTRGAQSEPRRVPGPFKFHLTIEVDDIERFATTRCGQAGAFGWVECDALGGRLPVERGRVQPVRRHRAGRQAHALPAVLPRRRRPPADDDRLQAGARRRGLRRLARHHDAVHARAARPRRAEGEEGGRARRLRRPAHPACATSPSS